MAGPVADFDDFDVVGDERADAPNAATDVDRLADEINKYRQEIARLQAESQMTQTKKADLESEVDQLTQAKKVATDQIKCLETKYEDEIKRVRGFLFWIRDPQCLIRVSRSVKPWNLEIALSRRYVIYCL